MSIHSSPCQGLPSSPRGGPLSRVTANNKVLPCRVPGGGGEADTGPRTGHKGSPEEKRGSRALFNRHGRTGSQDTRGQGRTCGSVPG